ncbi:MAG: hypothetical protein ABDI20_09530, partial [Candidatus Bipolaricaulaceae bacterium]
MRRLQTLGYLAGFLGVLLALVALLRVSGIDRRVTQVREELLLMNLGTRIHTLRPLSTRVDSLSTDLSKVSSEVRTLTGEVSGARSRLDQVSKDLASLTTRVAALDSARLEELSRRVGAVAEELAQLRERLARWEAEQAKVVGALARLEAAEREVAALRSQLAALDAGKIEATAQRMAGVAEDLGRLQARLSALEAEQAAALAELAAQGLRLGVVDAETLFLRVFLPQVAPERRALQAKAQALQELQARYAQGQISSPFYQQEYARLQAEYVQALAQVNLTMCAKMLASPGFADLRAELQALQDQALTWAEEAEALVRQARGTVLNYAEFFGQIQQVQAAFQQVDQLLTQAAAAKILRVAQEVAREQGFHLVLRTKDVVLYF